MLFYRDIHVLRADGVVSKAASNLQSCMRLGMVGRQHISLGTEDILASIIG